MDFEDFNNGDSNMEDDKKNISFENNFDSNRNYEMPMEYINDKNEPSQNIQEPTNIENIEKVKNDLKKKKEEEEEALKRKRDELLNQVINRDQVDHNELLGKSFSIPLISKKDANSVIYKHTTLFYASSKEIFDDMRTFIDYHDSTYDIEDFEKGCSLAQPDSNEMVKMWVERNKDKKRQAFKEKKKDEEEGSNVLDEVMIKGDVRKDIENCHAYQDCIEAIRDSNELNGYEYYDQIFKKFCNEFFIGDACMEPLPESERIDTNSIKRKNPYKRKVSVDSKNYFSNKVNSNENPEIFMNYLETDGVTNHSKAHINFNNPHGATNSSRCDIFHNETISQYDGNMDSQKYYHGLNDSKHDDKKSTERTPNNPFVQPMGGIDRLNL